MKRLERFVGVADTHGFYQDDAAVAALFDFCKHYKPDFRFHLGDFIDIPALREGAGEYDKSIGLDEDSLAAESFIRRFDPKLVLMGNHDYRLTREIAKTKNGMTREYCTLIWRRMSEALKGRKVVPYGVRDGKIKYGDFKLLHGYTSGQYAAMKTATDYGNAIIGHVHTPGIMRTNRDDGAVGHSVGCLCKLNMGFNVGHQGTLKQAHGFVYGVKTSNGKLVIWHAEPKKGVWYFPSEITERSYGKCA